MKSGRFFGGPFIALFAAMAVGWLMQPDDSFPLRLPSRPAPAPEWALRDLTGHTNRLSDYSGRIVLLNFWATYCPPCIREIPDLSAFHRSQATNGVSVIGIASEPDASSVVPDFVKSYKIPYPVLLADAQVVEQYGVLSLPQTFVLDPSGRIVGRFIGRMRTKDLEAAIAPLLAARLTNGAPATGLGER
jgi:peroxiredoxin